MWRHSNYKGTQDLPTGPPLRAGAGAFTPTWPTQLPSSSFRPQAVPPALPASPATRTAPPEPLRTATDTPTSYHYGTYPILSAPTVPTPFSVLLNVRSTHLLGQPCR